MKIKRGIPLIDQHDKNGFYGGKFGGNYVAETLGCETQWLLNNSMITKHALIIFIIYFISKFCPFFSYMIYK